MRLRDLLRQWSTFPVVEQVTYRCTDCGTVLEEDGPACPECGGETEATSHESIELYWPHH